SWIIRVIEFEFLQDRDDLLGAYRVLRKATHKVERGLARKGGELFFRPQRAELLDRVLYRSSCARGWRIRPRVDRQLPITGLPARGIEDFALVRFRVPAQPNLGLHELQRLGEILVLRGVTEYTGPRPGPLIVQQPLCALERSLHATPVSVFKMSRIRLVLRLPREVSGKLHFGDHNQPLAVRW